MKLRNSNESPNVASINQLFASNMSAVIKLMLIAALDFFSFSIKCNDGDFKN